MQIFAVAVGADGLKRPQRRHQGVVAVRTPCSNRLEVHIPDLGLAGDLVGRGLRDDAEVRLGERQGGFEVEPFLDPVLVIEDRAELVGAPQILEQDRIEDPGRHADYFTALEKAILCPMMEGPQAIAGKPAFGTDAGVRPPGRTT